MHTLRSLARSRGYALATVAILALGIGAVSSIFSLVSAALLRPPPFAHVDRLVLLFTSVTSERGTTFRSRWSWKRIQRLVADARSFDAIGSYSVATVTITGTEEPEPVEAEVVAPGYFSALGISPSLGRAFVADENRIPGARPVAIVSDALWRRRFATDSAVVGKTIGINGITLNVVGVAPPGFRGLSDRAELWITPMMAPLLTYDGYLTTNQSFISLVARLRPDVSVARASAEVSAITARLRADEGLTDQEEGSVRQDAAAILLSEARVDAANRRALLLLLAAVGLLLLVAATNVAGLQMARAAARQREIAVRVALGAGRARVVRLLLAESSVLAVCGGAVGTLLAVWITPLIGVPSGVLGPRNLYGSIGEFAAPGALDWRVLLFTIALIGATSLLVGVLPAFQATRVDLVSQLKDGAPAAARGTLRLRGAAGARALVVVAEVATAFVLLAGGALVLGSWRNLTREELGFEREGLLTFMVRPSEVRYPAPAAPAMLERMLAAISQVPGVVAATVDGCAPVGTSCANSGLYFRDRPNPPDRVPSVLRHYVGPDHFKTLGIPVLRGRVFTAADRGGRNKVAVISRSAARRFWPNQNLDAVIGQRVWFGARGYETADSSAEIVGIVGDVAYQPLDQNPFQADFYTPYLQFTYANRMVLVRTQGRDPLALVPDLRRAVRAADPDLAPVDVRTMEGRLAGSWAKPRFYAILLGSFSVAAILLAASGIYAVVAYTVGQRTREMGIRLALGAGAPDVVALVVRQGLTLPLAGIAIGVAVALGATRTLRSLLYGVSPTDPAVLSGVAGLVAVVALLACYFPARRVTRIDPLLALKAE